MSKFIKNMSIFFGGLPLLMSKDAGAAMDRQAAVEILTEPLAVQLRPLNLPSENLFAGHRSHSSHSSHASHYSGAGSSSYTAPAAPASQYQQPYVSPQTTPTPSQQYPQQLLSPQAAPAKAPTATTPTSPNLSYTEKLKLQIIRVQIALTSLGLYQSNINGILTPETKAALRLFQEVKGIPSTGLMTTQTLNALGVPAVN